MSESQMKKMKHAIEKVAKKRSRSGKARVGRGALPKKAFQQAVSKAVNNMKAKTGMGYRDTDLTAAIDPNAATKYFIADPTGAGANVFLINGVAVGASDVTHTNKKYLNHGSYLRGQIVGDATAKANEVALVWVLDTEPTGAMPAITDIFANATATKPCVFSQLNPDGSSRFRILARRNYSLHGDPDDVGETRANIYVEEYINLKNFETVTKGVDNGTIGTIQKNALYLCLLGSTPSGSTAAAKFNFGAHRLQFMDQ